jgi:hypothetical protein
MDSRACDVTGEGGEARESRGEVVVMRAFEPGWASQQAMWASYEAVIPIVSKAASALEGSEAPVALGNRLKVELA